MSRSPLLTVENQYIRVSAISLGGRVVQLSRPGGANVLTVDEALLGPYALRARPVSLNYRFQQWNGHTVWCGPQSRFWGDQDVAPDRKAQAGWPPDPYGEVGWFTVLEHTHSRLVLQGPESPVTGLQLTKTIELTPHGARFSVSARNVRDREVTWDLWPNTRVDGYARVYVPVAEGEVVRVSGGSKRSEPLAHRITGGCFTFDPAPPCASRNRFAKAFLAPAHPQIAAFTGSDCLRIRVEPIPRSHIHPEQAQVELYNAVDSEGQALLELETHGALRTLSPGESMHVEQHWDVHEYAGESSDSARIAFMHSLR